MSQEQVLHPPTQADDGDLTVRRLAERVLASLGAVIDFDAAWLSVCDPRLRTQAVVTSRGLNRTDLELLADPRWTVLGRDDDEAIHPAGDPPTSGRFRQSFRRATTSASPP